MIFTTGKARNQVQEFRIVFRFHFIKSTGLRNGGKIRQQIIAVAAGKAFGLGGSK
jgi:hypothetical protein